MRVLVPGASGTLAPFVIRALLIAQWQPTLLPYADRLHGHGSFFSTQKLAQAVGWQHQTSWRTP
jgi:hypothetical protein